MYAYFCSGSQGFLESAVTLFKSLPVGNDTLIPVNGSTCYQYELLILKSSLPFLFDTFFYQTFIQRKLVRQLIQSAGLRLLKAQNHFPSHEFLSSAVYCQQQPSVAPDYLGRDLETWGGAVRLQQYDILCNHSNHDKCYDEKTISSARTCLMMRRAGVHNQTLTSYPQTSWIDKPTSVFGRWYCSSYFTK